jgi:hypothetical protein
MLNHNETLVKAAPMGLKVKTKVKAGALTTNHNETLVQEPKGLRAQGKDAREGCGDQA